ncbi:uncharacterized protein N7487_005161 [Penicillium crustosum]|uniref:uncharacterized protein n=1 Tax=Penicillium crustosum TaxID=36656 RepID=UPI002382E4F4|nr:uncharacterized protein N7487_005161 [Penicillium crustosum]KAJ5410802.1 hypothetical protein N7487_005161 [Penicillium crustosum]
MASKKSKLPNSKEINYPEAYSPIQKACWSSATVFLEKADPPPGSPTWWAEPMDGTKPARWAPTDPLGFSSEPAKLKYNEWEREYGAQKRMTDTCGLTYWVPVLYPKTPTASCLNQMADTIFGIAMVTAWPVFFMVWRRPSK